MRPLTKSIAWQLQFWHAAILLCVVCGLSAAWFLQSRRALVGEIDAELLAAARVLDGSLRGFRLPGMGSADGPEPHLSPADDERLSLPRGPMAGAGHETSMYFAVWMRDGRLLKSQHLPNESSVEFNEFPQREPVFVDQLDKFRQVRIIGPSGTQILVGRDIGLELASLRVLAGQIMSLSIGILLIGLTGGWWLARSVLRPIQSMSETASQFSVANMGSRIDIDETESELGELARILNEAFDRIEASFQQQQQFAADASHELRTPLAVIQSQIELALKKERSPAEYVKALSICSGARERLSELVESLLVVARLESQREPIEHSVVRLDRIGAKCIDLMRPVAEYAEVELVAELEPASIWGNPKQLERALLNLLKNAINYNVPNGSVHITVVTINSSVRLTIRDTGIGISKDDLPYVAKRFYRVDKARSRQHGGSGLGLSIADEIFKAHQATIVLTSELDQGTVIQVLFQSVN